MAPVEKVFSWAPVEKVSLRSQQGFAAASPQPVGKAISNSMCSVCTGCKSACPDIDLSKSYWRELSDQSQRFFYYGYPGLVASYYGWFYLHRGSFEYYLSGAWLREQISLWEPAFFFWPIPKLYAVPLLLVVGIAGSYGLFVLVEKRWATVRADRAWSRHVTVCIGRFVAFVLLSGFVIPRVFSFCEPLAGLVLVLFAAAAVRWMTTNIRAFPQVSIPPIGVKS